MARGTTASVRALESAAPGAAQRVRRWREAAPLLAGGAWYLAFITRSAVVVDGRLRFPLVDDAMISMRYARELATGHGLAWNPSGRAVDGYSNLLWTLWMSALHALRLDGDAVSLLVMLSGAALLLGNVVLVRRIARRLAPGSELVAQGSAWGAAFCYPLVFWTLRGLEPGLVALLLSGSVLLALREVEHATWRNVAALSTLLVLCVLARDDMLVEVALLCGFVGLRSRGRTRLMAAAVPAATVACAFGIHAGVRAAVYGDPLPTTYYDKLAGIGLGLRLHTGISWLVPTVVVALFPLLLGAAAYIVVRGRAVSAGAMLLLALWLGVCAYSVYVGGDAWEFEGYANRFVAPAIPLLLVAAAMGLQALVQCDGATRRRALAWLGALSGLAAVAIGVEASLAVPQAVALPDMQAHVLVVVPALSALLCLALWRWSGGRVAPLRGAAVVAAVSVAGSAALPLVGWAQSNALWLACDTSGLRVGVALADATGGHTAVAASAAGAIPYWAGGIAVDPLGLSDAHIAHESPHSGPLRPGHMKWDLGYSIGALRPDVIATLSIATPADDVRLAAWGYTHPSPSLWVRSDSRYASEVTRLVAPVDEANAALHC